MSKYFTYSNLPEHQVAIYHDREEQFVDKPGKQDFVSLIITCLWSLLLLLTCPISVFFCIKILKDYEKAVVFRLGRLLPPKGPGVICIMPCLDRMTRVDMRMRAFNVPPQEVLTKDEGWISVGADIQFSLIDPVLSLTAVQDLNHSLRMLAQTALVNRLSTKTIAQAEADKKFIDLTLQNDLNKSSEKWGVKVERVTISQIRVLKEASVSEGVDVVNLFKGGPDTSTINVLSGLIASASGVSTQAPAFKTLKPASHVTPEFLVQQVTGVLDEGLVRELGGLYQFNIHGENGGTWIMDLTSGSGSIYKGSSPSVQPNVVLTMDEGNMQRIFRGELTPFNAYMQELLKVEGDLKMAMNLDVIIEKIKKRRTHEQSGVFVV
ncbi:stomatin-like protein 1 [Exaiptasia diaphana]|uniref:Band 7 domain-containing protein n=1 Tax=Exaiptasia diaphana TaxID=2652724 RepID=A0A913XB94_EXADI|nr:stomatin-like protein 1 [Exaiptasia diaphana]KXJ13355.1 Stomatin-like protein 1 [Exaiptasia diaphana]